MSSTWQTDEVPNLYLTALCCWREARGESRDGWRGVLHVIRDRALRPSWWGNGYVGVILQPQQFSSFNHDSSQAVLIPGDRDPVFPQILECAANVLSGDDEDLTGGATYYHTYDVHPDWDKHLTVTATIGSHIFYK